MSKYLLKNYDQFYWQDSLKNYLLLWVRENWKHTVWIDNCNDSNYSMKAQVRVQPYNHDIIKLNIYFGVSREAVRKDNMGDYVCVTVKLDKTTVYNWNELIQGEFVDDDKAICATLNKVFTRLGDALWHS